MEEESLSKEGKIPMECKNNKQESPHRDETGNKTYIRYKQKDHPLQTIKTAHNRRVFLSLSLA